MSIIKLAVYGGIGYLIYQNFFNEGAVSAPAGEGSGRQGQRTGGGGARGQMQRRPQAAGRSSQGLTGPGKGMNVPVQDSGGAATTHRVGRGVV
jgi:hypothetical protein